MKAKTTSWSRFDACASGFVTGLSAPALLITGELEILQPRQISTLSETWQNVGQTIRSSAEQYKIRHGASTGKR